MNKYCNYCNKALRKGSAPTFHKSCYPKWKYQQLTKIKLNDFVDPYGLYLPPSLRNLK